MPLNKDRAMALEALEQRVLLSGAIDVPSLIDPDQAAQILFAPGLFEHEVAASSGGSQRLFKFALDSPGGSGPVQVDLAPLTSGSGSNAALALYDENGNLILKVDQDADPAEPGAETLITTIDSRKVHVLGVFFSPGGPAVDFRYTVQTDPQIVNTIVAINPATGSAQLHANSGQDTFNAPADVDYYPLELLNGGSGGTVTVTPTGLDVKVFATLFARSSDDEPWRAIDVQSGASGGPVTLALVPPAGASLTDGQFLVAAAPLGFNTAARSYRIDVAASLLGPATVNPGGAAYLAPTPPVQPGAASLPRSFSLAAGGQSLHRMFLPEIADEVLVAVSTGAFQPVLSVYDAAGTTLIAAGSSAAPGAVSLAVPSSFSGQSLIVRVADIGSDQGGTFTIDVQHGYTPQELTLAAGFQSYGSFALGESLPAQFLRVQPAAGTDVLVLRLQPGAGLTGLLGIVGPDLDLVLELSSSGQAVVVPVDIAGHPGPFDLYLAGRNGSGTAQLQIGQLAIPKQLGLNQLPLQNLNIFTGQLGPVSQSAGGFGSLSGMGFWQYLADLDPPDPLVTTMSVQGTGGGLSLLVRYEEQGGVYKLADYAVPNAAGAAQLASDLPGRRLRGVAAISLLPEAGTNSLTIHTPPPAPVGVGMVPDLATPQHDFILSIRNAALHKQYEQHLWKTILPWNMTSQPTVSFERIGLAGATVRVYLLSAGGPDANGVWPGTLLANQTLTAPPLKATITLNASVAQLKGRTIVFHIQPAAGQLGDGTYKLEMSVPTTDPHPFEVTETAWKVYGTNPPIPSPDNDKVGTFPLGLQVVDVIQDHLGYGTIDGTFTSSEPYTSGKFMNANAIDVYRFWAVTPGPVSVWTSPIDPDVNTNIAIYQARYLPNGQLSYFGQVPETSLSLDWFPADRSQIDAKVHINNFDLMLYPEQASHYGLDRGAAYYIVVKNEQGTIGRYELHVQAQPFPLSGEPHAAGGQVTYLPQSGTASVPISASVPGEDRIGYFPIQVPKHHAGTLTITSRPHDVWKLRLFDRQGAALPGTMTTGFGGSTVGIFQIDPGEQVVYLRAQAVELFPWGTGNALTVSTTLAPPPLHSPPPALLPPSAPLVLLPTTPTGTGQSAGALGANRAELGFAFRAAAGVLTVQVIPQNPADLRLRWGIYADGKLIAASQTSVDGAAGLTTLTAILPHLPQPLDPIDYAYDTNQYHDVVVYVMALNDPAGSGAFSVSVQTEATRPMLDHRLEMNPRATNAQATLPASIGATAINWLRLRVPAGITAPVQLALAGTGGNAPVRYDLFDTEGNLVSSQTALTTPGVPFTFTLTGAAGGQTYWLRAGVVNRPLDALGFTVTAPLPKAHELNHRPPAELDLIQTLQQGGLTRAFLNPQGNWGPTGSGDVLVFPHSVIFWAGSPGTATFSAFALDPALPYLALYRAEKQWIQPLGQPGGWVWKFRLVDYTNSGLSLGAWVEPGMYLLRYVQLNQSFSGINSINAPAMPAKHVVLDPSSGMSIQPSMLDNDRWRDGYGLPVYHYANSGDDFLDPFRTTFYEVIAPAASQDDAQGFAFLSGGGQPFFGPGRAYLHIYEPQPNGSYLRHGGGTAYVQAPSPLIAMANVGTGDFAEPGSTYYIAVDRMQLGSVAVGAFFLVPQSGLPDLVVRPLVVLPAGGKTQVEVTIRNIGYAPAPPGEWMFQYSDTSKNPVKWETAGGLELPMGAFGVRFKTFIFVPVEPTDEMRYATNTGANPFEEASYENNLAEDILWNYNKHKPQVQVLLSPAALDGMAAADRWGRYIAGVDLLGAIVIQVQDLDGPQDRYQAWGTYPKLQGAGNDFISIGKSAGVTIADYNLGKLQPTGANAKNQIQFVARDRWGLLSDEVVITINVVPFPTWLQGSGNTLVFNPSTLSYDFEYVNALLDQGGTLEKLTGLPIPFIGNKQNIFRARMVIKGSASLNPTTPVSAPVTAELLVRVLGADVMNEKWTGQVKQDNWSLSTDVHIDSRNLELAHLTATFRLIELKLFQWESPKIVLLAYGVPGVASINANLRFLVDVTLNAAITLALKLPDGPIDPLVPTLPGELGLASPTFIAPKIGAGLKISGEIEVLGFDLASISGTVMFELEAAYGLTTPKSEFVPIGQFFNKSNLNLNGVLYGVIEANVLFIEVFSYEFPHYQINFTPGGGQVVMSSLLLDGNGLPLTVTPGGNEPVGAYGVGAAPNLVVDHANGNALYVQAVDVIAGPGVQGGLVHSRRTGGAWSPLQPLSSATHVSNPVLALTNDGPGTRGVVVYQAIDGGSDLSLLTRNQFLTGQNLHYRYYDGTAWGPAVALTSNSRYEFDHALAFNANGQGALAWVRNTNPSPVAGNGIFDRSSNEIMVARWNPATRTWGTPQQLTTNGVADGRPAVHVDENGRMYVVWLRDTAGGNTVMYSVFDGAWSAPAELPMIGLPSDGRITNLAIASQGPGRINILLSHRRELEPDEQYQFDPVTGETYVPAPQVETVLYGRTSTLAGFGLPTPLEEIARDGTFSGLATTNGPDGALIAYWQQGTGANNEIYFSAIGGGRTAWSRPVLLSAEADIILSPQVAVDTDGELLVVYELRQAPQFEGFDLDLFPAPRSYPGIGVPAAGNVIAARVNHLPELSFDRGLFFLGMDRAPSGTHAIGQATLVNRGLSGDHVLIEYLEVTGGGDVVVGSQVIALGAGAAYEIAHPFLVRPGEREYGIRVAALGGQEAIGSDDKRTTATLTGMPDIEIVSVTASHPNPAAGATIDIVAVIRNTSDQPIAPFQVTMYDGDPFATWATATPLASTQISLAPFEVRTVTFSWTVPDGARARMLTVWADSQEQIAEAVEVNNHGRVLFTLTADPAIDRTLASPVTATVLNYTGVNNVAVAAGITNHGEASVVQLRVLLQWSWEDGPYVNVAQVIIPSLAPGEQVLVNFTATGWAGVNRYRIIIDPDDQRPDIDRSNNVAETRLIVTGLADLEPVEILLAGVLKQNDPILLRTTLYNHGIAPAENFTVEIFAGDWMNGGVVIGSALIPRLGPLSAMALEIPLDTGRLAGAVQIFIVVDRLEEVLESNGMNNWISDRFIFEHDRLTVDVRPIEPNPRDGPVEEARIVFSSPVTGFDLSDIRIIHNGGTPGPVTGLTLETEDGANWILRGLANLTNQPGTYVLSVIAFRSGIQDAAGNELEDGDAESFTVNSVFSIRGRKFLDGNANGIADPGEPGLGGWIIYLDLNRDGQLNPGEPSTITDAWGNWSFANLSPGTYTIREVQQPGWVQTTPEFYTVNIFTSSPSVTTLDFGNTRISHRDEAGGHMYYVRLDDRGTHIEIFVNAYPPQDPAVAGSAAPAFVTALASTPVLVFDTGGADGLLIVDFSRGSPVPAGGIHFLGGSGADVLQIIGTEGADQVRLEDGRLRVGDDLILHSGLHSLFVATLGGDDVLTIDAELPGEITFIAGDGWNTLNLNAGRMTYHADAALHSDQLTINVNNAGIIFNSSMTLQALNLGAGAEATITIGGNKTLLTRSLTIAGSAASPAGRLDIGAGFLIVDYPATAGSPLLTIAEWVRAGFAGGTWGGNGITSSAAGAVTGRTIGYGDNATLRRSSFGGVAVDNSSVLVMLTIPGDANLDGRVDGEDFLSWQANFGRAGNALWPHGDFNHDRRVDGEDFLSWQANFGASMPLPAAPTPGSAATAALPPVDESLDESQVDESPVPATADDPPTSTSAAAGGKRAERSVQMPSGRPNHSLPKTAAAPAPPGHAGTAGSPASIAPADAGQAHHPLPAAAYGSGSEDSRLQALFSRGRLEVLPEFDEVLIGAASAAGLYAGMEEPAMGKGDIRRAGWNPHHQRPGLDDHDVRLDDVLNDLQRLHHVHGRHPGSCEKA